MNNQNYDPERRAAAWLHSVFSVNGKFSVDAIQKFLTKTQDIDTMFFWFQQTTQSRLPRANFEWVARVLMDAYVKRRIPIKINNFAKASRRRNHDEWLRAMTVAELKSLPNRGLLDYVQEPLERLINVDLVPQLVRLFDRTVPYVSVSRGAHYTQTFKLPDNVAIVFPKSLGTVIGGNHVQALGFSFTDPWIVREYLTNPVWGTGTDEAYDWFRNRVYAPPGTITHDAFIDFRVDDGLFAMYDATRGTKSLPTQDMPGRELNLAQSWFPKSSEQLLLSQIVQKISQNGGGIYVPVFSRHFRDNKDYTLNWAKQQEDNLVKKRREKADRLLAENIASMYGMTTGNPMIRELRTGSKNQIVSKDYAYELLKWHHLGPITSKTLLKEHKNPRLEKNTLFFTKGNRRYVMNVQGKPVPEINTSEIQTEVSPEIQSAKIPRTNTSEIQNLNNSKSTRKPGKQSLIAATAATAAGVAGVAGGLWYLRSKNKKKK